MCDCPDMHNKHAIYILLLSPILGGLLLAVAEQIPFAGFLFMSRVTSCLLLVVTTCLWVRNVGYMLAENGSLWTGFYGYREDLWSLINKRISMIGNIITKIGYTFLLSLHNSLKFILLSFFTIPFSEKTSNALN